MKWFGFAILDCSVYSFHQFKKVGVCHPTRIAYG
jgi:hypothetical protein